MKLNDIRDLSKEDMLSVLGLASKPTTTEKVLGRLGLFGVGLLVGAGAALLLAPQSGEDLREDLGQRLRDLKDGARQGLEASTDHASADSALPREDSIRT